MTDQRITTEEAPPNDYWVTFQVEVLIVDAIDGQDALIQAAASTSTWNDWKVSETSVVKIEVAAALGEEEK